MEKFENTVTVFIIFPFQYNKLILIHYFLFYDVRVCLKRKKGEDATIIPHFLVLVHSDKCTGTGKVWSYDIVNTEIFFGILLIQTKFGAFQTNQIC